MRCEVVPELGFGEDNELSVAIGLLSAPEIDKAREGALVLCEVQAPDTRELGTIIGRGTIVALEEAFVEQLYGPGLGEVGIVTVVGQTKESGMLIAARDVIQTTVILDVGCDGRLLAEVKLT